MSVRETAHVFSVNGGSRVGVTTWPAAGAVATLGVLILVGGPQYRVGSHRHFVELARTVAAAGYPAFRFDFCGMGDSDGEPLDFSNTGADVAAAIDHFVALTGVSRVVLLGLCDGASGAAIYLGEAEDPRVAGLCLLNPWVRSKQSAARARMKHYYLDRLRDPDFWRKLRRGRLSVASSVVDFLRNLRQSRQDEDSGPAELSFQARMARALGAGRVPVLVALSGRDQVGQEFRDALAGDPLWSGCRRQSGWTECPIVEADHTFSDAAGRHQLNDALLVWLGHLR